MYPHDYTVFSLSKPLHNLLKNCLEKKCFPNEWKKLNIVPAYKKEDQQLITNYWLGSLLPICAKMFEKILFEYLPTNKLLNNNQSGFNRGERDLPRFI